MTTTTLTLSVYSAPETFEIIAGKSLGDVLIGETSESLKQKNFTENTGYALSESYLKRDGLNARLFGGKVAQAWVDTEHLKKLRYLGKPLPSAGSSKTFRQFFSGCENSIKGSGGIMIYCENRGLRLEFSFDEKSFGGLSVVDLADYESVVGKK